MKPAAAIDGEPVAPPKEIMRSHRSGPAQTSAQIDMQLRAARRELVDLAADLAVASAKERLRAETTADDQQRLIERYVSQVRSTHDQAR